MAATEQQREELQILIGQEIAEIMDTPGGRYLFWQLIQATSVFTPEQSMTPEAACFNEGKRWFGLYVTDLLFTHAPEKFMLMRDEGVVRDQILGTFEEEEEAEHG